jgi:hypothetical protein
VFTDLNQLDPADIIVEGWSKAENVGGEVDDGYSIKVTLTFADGTTKYAHEHHLFSISPLLVSFRLFSPPSRKEEEKKDSF